MAHHFRFYRVLFRFFTLVLSLVSCLLSLGSYRHWQQHTPRLRFSSSYSLTQTPRKAHWTKTVPTAAAAGAAAAAAAVAAAAAAVVISVRREWTSPASDMRTDWCWDAMPTVSPPPALSLHPLTTQATPDLCANPPNSPSTTVISISLWLAAQQNRADILK